jgi:hypothetical protein
MDGAPSRHAAWPGVRPGATSRAHTSIHGGAARTGRGDGAGRGGDGAGRGGDGAGRGGDGAGRGGDGAGREGDGAGRGGMVDEESDDCATTTTVQKREPNTYRIPGADGRAVAPAHGPLLLARPVVPKTTPDLERASAPPRPRARSNTSELPVCGLGDLESEACA